MQDRIENVINIWIYMIITASHPNTSDVATIWCDPEIRISSTWGIRCDEYHLLKQDQRKHTSPPIALCNPSAQSSAFLLKISIFKTAKVCIIFNHWEK